MEKSFEIINFNDLTIPVWVLMFRYLTEKKKGDAIIAGQQPTLVNNIKHFSDDFSSGNAADERENTRVSAGIGVEWPPAT